ncbi:MAG: hypothetical protein IJR91_04565 [Ruminococcus sp.]|nr:hypothetical protein [Ruminococcus sp.]
MLKKHSIVFFAAVIAILCVGCENQGSNEEANSSFKGNIVTTISTTTKEAIESEVAESVADSINEEFMINTNEKLIAFLNKSIKNTEEAKEEEFMVLKNVETINDKDKDEHRGIVYLSVDGFPYCSVVDSDTYGIRYIEFGTAKADQYAKKWDEYTSEASKERDVKMLNKLLFVTTFFDLKAFPKDQRTTLAENIINYIYKNYYGFQVRDNYYRFNFRFDDYIIGISMIKYTKGEFEGKLRIFNDNISIYPYERFIREKSDERIIDSSDL